MTGTSILTMLFGAALVAIGVLSAALADRIRGLRVSREVAPRAKAAIPVVEHVVPVPTKAPRTPRAEVKTQYVGEGAEEVIAALVASGYKKPAATEAAWACTAAERATVEIWAAAALRRCARGGMS